MVDIVSERSLGSLRIVGSRLGRPLRIVLVGALLVSLVGPSLLVVLMSFTDAPFLQFPPADWGTGQYSALVESELWRAAFRRSVQMGLMVSPAALIIGTLFVFGLHRSRFPRLASLELLALAPLIVPAVAYAVALFDVFADLGLIATRAGIFLAHTILALPFVVLIVGSAISRIPQELEQAAMGLGASRGRAYRDVTLRMLIPALAGAAVLGFFASFDEVVLVSFLSGPGFKTLPLEIFHSLLTGLDPVISAISAILIGGSAISLSALFLFRRR
jgi:ABC-type spermidine/putrescine transport system permease subunit II